MASTVGLYDAPVPSIRAPSPQVCIYRWVGRLMSVLMRDQRPAKREAPEESSFESESLASTATTPPRSPRIKSEPGSPSRPHLQDYGFGSLNSYIPVGVLKRPNHCGEPPPLFEFPAEEVTKLEFHEWIRTRTFTYQSNPEWCYVRVYVLPDDLSGRQAVSHFCSAPALRRALKVVMEKVDRSPEAWEGQGVNEIHAATGCSEESLWYIFNTLEDPAPDVEAMRDPYARNAMAELLACPSSRTSVAGLKTPLYPYQRRSAAMMVQREAQPAQVLDPRLTVCSSPDGREYYYDKEDGSVVREKRLYSEPCGGILSETMGCGKTLICLALILATRGHFPRIPAQYQELETPVRPQTASLVKIAATIVGRLSLPWQSHFDRLKRQGVSYSKCIRACEDNCGAYTIPPPPAKYGGRNSVAYSRPPPRHIRLCSGTLVVAPPNLVDHWQHEISQHTEGLKVLVLRTKDATPSADELTRYDIVLFSRTRFEKEAGETIQNYRESSVPDKSPLLKLHWLRIIVDEGHNVAGSGHRTTMVHLLDQLCVERRWAVSGTPSSGLYGVEVSLASQTNASDMDLPTATAATLQSRKKTGSLDNDLSDIDKLRYIVVNFLDLKPWSNSRSDDPANWTKYMKPIGKDGRRSKALSLRATLQSLVIRHRMDVIHSEIPLPTLHNQVISLEPTFFDKLNLNLFIFIIAVNAVTSERRDQDYMFHPRNRKYLGQVIDNLRQSGFWWAGSEGNLAETVNTVARYMEKNRDKMSEIDIATMTEGTKIAQQALNSKSWNAFREFHELGVFVERFPSDAQSFWALDQISDEPLLLGITHAGLCQKFITSHLDNDDPAEGLSGAGIRARSQRRKSSDGKKNHPSKPARRDLKSPKKSYTQGLFRGLPSNSPLQQSKLIATTSAKLTYLLDKVQELQTEKIIIFYDHSNTAFWIAEGLELLGVDFRIYANSLKSGDKTAYLTLFRESPDVRVLLMDLRQAAHGLHLANASRMFIVNPIWDPNIESQAIKRAHRIGQTRPVYVETLVLSDTLEDRMLKRRKEMTDAEIQHAEKDLLDDSTMSSIIQNEGFIPMEEEHAARVRFLRHPTGFFDRHRLPIPDPSAENTESSPSPAGATPRKRKPKRVAFAEISPAPSPSKRPRMATPIRSLFGGGSQESDSPGEAMQGENELPPFTFLD